MRQILRNSLLALALLGIPAPTGALAGPEGAPPEQLAQYQAEAPKTILELQPFRHTTSRAFTDASGRRGTVTLVEVNPNINAWLLVRIDWESPPESRTYHLENTDPHGTHISLTESGAQGLHLSSAAGQLDCILWPDRGGVPLEQARRTGLPYAPLCDGRIYLRNVVAGTYTHLEEVTNFLRDHVWGGDRIVNFVKEQFFRDAFAEKGSEVSASAGAVASNAPSPAQMDVEAAATAIVPEHLNLDLGGAESRGLAMGAYTAFLDLALGLANPLLGLVAGRGGVRAVFLVSTLVVLCSVAVASRLVAARESDHSQERGPASLEGEPSSYRGVPHVQRV